MSVIRFEQVLKQFPSAPRPSVNAVSFEVESGQFIVFLGPSGCGKTTLLKMVNRLYEPTSGQILINGDDIQTMPETTLRRGIGYVIQQIGLFPHMTVADNIAVVPRLLSWDKQRIDERIDELLELIELAPAEYRDRYPAQMSGGQQQRVGLARALAADPDVMLMDEPFGAIDAITRTSLQDEMLRLQRQLRKTILFVTHDVEEALRLADKIVIMRMGEVVQYDTPFNILTKPANSFVAELVDAHDMVRQLGLIRVEQVMEALPTSFVRNGHPTIQSGDDLRAALSLLLRSPDHDLLVLEQNKPVGTLSLKHIQTASTLAEDS